MRWMCALVLAAACGEAIDKDKVNGMYPIDGYETWWKLEVYGPVPGHGDTYRIIYVNDVGRAYPHGGRYAVGTVIVKEIRDLMEPAAPGDLRYRAIMRKVGEDAEDVGAPVDGGWIFSDLRGDDVGGDEKYFDLCWEQCHVQGRWDGAWFDYGL